MTGSLPMPVTVVMAAVMGGTALYCAGRLALAPLRARATDRSADLLHVVMGTVMAASLLGVLNRRWDLVWVLGFLAAGLWLRPSGGRSAVPAPRSGTGCSTARPAWRWCSCWPAAPRRTSWGRPDPR